jgi:hypothetical protein
LWILIIGSINASNTAAAAATTVNTRFGSSPRNTYHGKFDFGYQFCNSKISATN